MWNGQGVHAIALPGGNLISAGQDWQNMEIGLSKKYHSKGRHGIDYYVSGDYDITFYVVISRVNREYTGNAEVWPLQNTEYNRTRWNWDGTSNDYYGGVIQNDGSQDLMAANGLTLVYAPENIAGHLD